MQNLEESWWKKNLPKRTEGEPDPLIHINKEIMNRRDMHRYDVVWGTIDELF